MPRANTPAVAYYRMSSDRQETSIPAQAVAVERLAAERGYRIVREYRDEGISGDATEKRTAFKAMMADCSGGDFAVVLCWDQDRFGRFDPLEAGYWLKPMRDAGVQLETVAQGLIDFEDFAGRIVWTVQQEAKHAFLRDLARNATRGLMEKAKRGEWASGAPPLGYQIGETGRLEVVEDDAYLVRRLFSLYDGGQSLRGVAETLNTEGVLPPRKRKGTRGAATWSPTTIKAILGNRTYIGEYSWNVQSRGKYVRVRDGAVERVTRADTTQPGGGDRFVFKDHHPAIIEAATFDRVNEKIKSRRGRSTPRRDRAFPLTGLCRCGHCGSPMNIHTTNPKGKSYRYIRCGGYTSRGSSVCAPVSIREDRLLPAVLGLMKERLTHPANADRLRAAIRRRVEDTATPADLSAVGREIAVLDADIDAAKRRVMEVDVDMLSVAQDHLRGLRERRDAAENRRRELEWRDGAGAADVDATVEAAIGAASRLAERIAVADPFRLREALTESIGEIKLEFSRQTERTRNRWNFARGTLRMKGESPSLQPERGTTAFFAPNETQSPVSCGTFPVSPPQTFRTRSHNRTPPSARAGGAAAASRARGNDSSGEKLCCTDS